MSILFKLFGSSTNNGMEVDSNNNGKVNLPTVKSQAGYAAMLSELDSGSVTGSRYTNTAVVDDDGLLWVGLMTPLLSETFNYTTQNSLLWKSVIATMTMTWNTTGLLFNANNTGTTTTGTCYTSYKHIPLNGGGGVKFDHVMSITATPVANQIYEAGLFVFTSGTAAPTEGVWFQLTSAGLIGVLNYNGSATQTGTLIAAAAFTANQNYKLRIVCTEREVQFWRDGILLGEIITPAGNSQPFATDALPISFQMRNGGTVSGTQMQVKVGSCDVAQLGLNVSKPFAQLQGGQGLMAYQAQNGATVGPTALNSNSLASGAGAAMTNTTAALGTGLGGQFSTQPTLAVGTDGIVCSYQNPVGSVNQTPRTLFITGVRIQSAVSTTALTGGPVLYAYTLAYGHTSVSLATGNGTAAKAPIRISLGYETLAAAAAVGTLGGGCSMSFQGPIVVNPGEFIAIAAKNLGVVTTAGVVTFQVTFDGFWQ